MEFEYDIAKSEANKVKHGISFEEAQEMWMLPGVMVSARSENEERFLFIGIWQGKYYSCVFTWRKEAARIISVRRSWEKEIKIFEESFKNEKEK